MTDYTRDDLVKVRFDFLQTGSLSLTVEIEPRPGETPEEMIKRAREAFERDYEYPVRLCAQCQGGDYGSYHKSDGGDGFYELALDEHFGDETGVEVEKGENDD